MKSVLDRGIKFNNINIRNYFLVFLLIITSSHVFFSGYQDELLLICAVMSIIFMFIAGKTFHPLFLAIVFVTVTWSISVTLEFDIWNTVTLGGFVIRLIMSYCIVVTIGKDFFSVLENVVYKLAFISIPMYFIGVLFPSVMLGLHEILGIAPTIFQFDKVGYMQEPIDSLGIYTFWVNGLTRNAGFMWEPTAYAILLIMALFIRFAFNRFGFDKHVFVLTLALLTTFSTTGYIAITLLLLYYYINSSISKRLWSLLLGVILLLSMANAQFLGDKVQEEIVRGAIQNEGGGNSRISSLIWDWKDFTIHPLLGVGLFAEVSDLKLNKFGSNNGLSDTFVRFGFFGAFFIFISLYISFKLFFLRSQYRIRASYLMFLSLLVLSVSERIYTLPLFLAFQFYYFTFLNVNYRWRV